MSQEEIKIEKGIPIPPKQGFRRWVNLLEKMKKGDSFQADTERSRNVVLITARRMHVKVTTRKVGDGKYRVWLIGKDGGGK